MADVTMPQLGETVTEGTINRWYKQQGETVAMDEVLFEVSTDKVDSEVPSPIAGTLTEILAPEGEVVEVGQVLARIENVGDAPVLPTADETSTAEVEQQEPTRVTDSTNLAPEPEVSPVEVIAHEQMTTLPPPPPPPSNPTSEPAAPSEVPSQAAKHAVVSPVVRRLINDNGLDPSTIVGSGIGGRITRADVETLVRAQAAVSPPPTNATPTPTPLTPPIPPTQPPPMPPPPPTKPATPTAPISNPLTESAVAIPNSDSVEISPRSQVVALNNIRKRTAEHMVLSKATSPHVLTAMEIDYEGVEVVRRNLKSSWKSQEGFSLTYLPFIARAVVDALAQYPHLNSSFVGDQLIVHDEVNLAIAVDIDFNGLLAPVIKGAEGKRLRQIARDVADVAARARTKQLLPDELTSGTFTITNAGQYGTMMQFPIINQPQVAILSTDGVSRKPVVVTDSFGNESIAVHSVGVLAMAWDHRAFDGAYAAAFLHRVKEIIESRDWEAEVR